MRGLDPRIHDALQRVSDLLVSFPLPTATMDGRVMPGHDRK